MPGPTDSNSKGKKHSHDVDKIRRSLKSVSKEKLLPEIPMITDDRILKTVFTHKTAATDPALYDVGECYERLEFIGDAFLNFVIALILFQKFEKVPEGGMSWYRDPLRSNLVFSGWAADYGLAKHLLPENMAKIIGEDSSKRAADLFEAYVGGLLMSQTISAPNNGSFSNFASCKPIEDWIKSLVDSKILLLQNGEEIHVRPNQKTHRSSSSSSSSSSNLQNLECCGPVYDEKYKYATEQLYSMLNPYYVPGYEILEENQESGDHKKVYKVACIVDKQVLGIGRSTTKKGAKAKAAESALKYKRETVNEYHNKMLEMKNHCLSDVQDLKEQLFNAGYVYPKPGRKTSVAEEVTAGAVPKA